MDSMFISALVSAGLLIVVIVAFAWCWQQLAALKQQVTVLSQQLESSQQQVSHAQAELEELRSGVIGVGQRVLNLQDQQQQFKTHLAELAEQQQAIALSDPESKIYSRAMKMVELGADLEEIIRECELPRAEAELLVNLHQQKQG